MDPHKALYEDIQSKRIDSGFGWFFLDVLWWFTVTVLFVVLAILMTSWLIVGPWRLLKYLLKSFTSIRTKWIE